MTIKEFLKQNEATIDQYIRFGIMPKDIRTDIALFEMYEVGIVDNSRCTAIQYIADQNNMSFSKAYRIIQKMERTV